MNLFEINATLTRCVKLTSGDFVDTETGEVIDTEAIDDLEMAMDEKVRNIACWVRNLDAEEKALAEKEARKQKVNYGGLPGTKPNKKK